MAQVTIAHVTNIQDLEAADFAAEVHKIVAREVHGMEETIEPNACTVLTVGLREKASISGADTELHVLISGNQWPVHDDTGVAYSPVEAKIYFNQLARRIFKAVEQITKRTLYVWVTPFVASGWAE